MSNYNYITGNLTQHIKVFCITYTTVISGNLTQHIKVFHKEVPPCFACGICGQTFKWKVSRKRHMKIHLRAKETNSLLPDASYTGTQMTSID